MSFVIRVVDETSEVDAIAAGEMLQDAESTDFFALVGREGDAMTQKEQRARWGQRGTSVERSGS